MCGRGTAQQQTHHQQHGDLMMTMDEQDISSKRMQWQRAIERRSHR
jgi:hypothetical protein